MNKEKRIKKLTWKYFWEQKWKEAKDFWDESGIPIIGFSCFIGVLLQAGWGEEKTYCVAIIGLCIIGFWILVAIRSLIIVIRDWINSNWEEAKKRAKREIKK